VLDGMPGHAHGCFLWAFRYHIHDPWNGRGDGGCHSDWGIVPVQWKGGRGVTCSCDRGVGKTAQGWARWHKGGCTRVCEM
jgi:hypothetical protein